MNCSEETSIKVSIITAAYKSKTTIGEAINSVANQTYPNIEHIIIEGKSEDGTLEEIRRYKHNRMRLMSESDDGLFHAFNKGIKEATGDVIGFVHSDDFFAHKKTLARIMAEFEDPTVEAVFSDLDYISNIDKSLVIRKWISRTFHPSLLKYGWMPAHPTLYLRREVYERLGLFDQNMRISGDYDFILRYFSQKNLNSVYIPETLYKMRIGGNSNCNWINIYKKMKEDMIAIRRNRTGGFHTLLLKSFSKIGQYFIKFDHKT